MPTMSRIGVDVLCMASDIIVACFKVREKVKCNLMTEKMKSTANKWKHLSFKNKHLIRCIEWTNIQIN